MDTRLTPTLIMLVFSNILAGDSSPISVPSFAKKQILSTFASKSDSDALLADLIFGNKKFNLSFMMYPLLKNCFLKKSFN